MPKRVKEPTDRKLHIRFRILCGEDIALGPGKIQLLKLVRETGSIRQAATDMQMSYMRAWGLIRTMNRCFKHPLVESARGGAKHGGAILTPAGLLVLELYGNMEKESLAATAVTRRKLMKLLTLPGATGR